ncbi:MAG: hypothetical protein HYT98_03320 [Candidatus Sungbacteria bacterium]|nr:hypothetical protein [Candidatus Sungbacteria bacterium]
MVRYRIRLLQEGAIKIDDTIDEWFTDVGNDDPPYQIDGDGFINFETSDGREIRFRPGSRNVVYVERPKI